MSRIHEMGRVVYWSAGALLVLNCVPHTLPGILKKRCALHSVNCTHCTLHTAHLHSLYTPDTYTLHTTVTHYPYSCELKSKVPPEELVAHVHRIAAAMVCAITV